MKKQLVLFTIIFTVLSASSTLQSENIKGNSAASPDIVGERRVNEKSARKSEADWPKTVDAAVIDILSSMTKKNREIIRKTPRFGLSRYHRGWGMGIRNSFGLWKGNHELMKSACGGFCSPDKASMVIIEAVWDALHASDPK